MGSVESVLVELITFYYIYIYIYIALIQVYSTQCCKANNFSPKLGSSELISHNKQKWSSHV